MKLTIKQSAECLSKSIEAMSLLADKSSPVFLALTGAAVRETAQKKLGLK